MPAPTRKRPLIRAEEIDSSGEFEFQHPLNDKSEVKVRPLALATGMGRCVVSRARVGPGKESFVYHSHQREEEWIYILSGRAVVEVDEEEIEVGPGDFLGFPVPSVAHQLRNPFDDEVVYLMGGEHRESEMASFPRLGKHMLREGTEVYVVDDANLKSFSDL